MLLNRERILVLGGTYYGDAYIAGTGEGIVTVRGVPSARQVVLLDQDTLELVQKTWSAPDGRYLLAGLDPNKKYIVLGIDYKGEYPPVAHDQIRPYLTKQTS